MILTISIIAAVLFFVDFLLLMIDNKSGNILPYSVILTLSIWAQDKTFGIITLVVMSVLMLVAFIKALNK